MQNTLNCLCVWNVQINFALETCIHLQFALHLDGNTQQHNVPPIRAATSETVVIHFLLHFMFHTLHLTCNNTSSPAMIFTHLTSKAATMKHKRVNMFLWCTSVPGSLLLRNNRPFLRRKSHSIDNLYKFFHCVVQIVKIYTKNQAPNN